MKQLFLFLLFFASGIINAQRSDNGLWLYGKDLGYADDDNSIGKEGIVGVKNCYVRDRPSTSGKLIDSLQLGKKVMVNTLAKTSQKIKGIEMNWVEIQYPSGNETRKGYLWLGFLALDFKTTDNLSFLTVLERVNAKEEEGYTALEYVLGIKVLDQNNIVLDSKEIRSDISESHTHRQNLMGNYGLQNIQNLYRISFSGEACGVPTYFFYFGWNGTKLLPMPGKMSVADAGIYSYSEDFIFPNEPGGKPNQIFKIIRNATVEESTNENEYPVQEEISKETYSWDGTQAKLIKKSLLRKGLVKQ